MDNILIIDEVFNIDNIEDRNIVEEVRFINRRVGIYEINVLNTLTNLKKLYFIDSKLDNLERLNIDIKTLYFDNCEIEEILDINKFNLDELFLENQDEIDLDDLGIIRNVNTLSFTNTKLLNEEKFIFMDKIVYLDLFNTGVKDLSIFMNMDNLKTLVIDEEMAKANKEFVLYMIEKGINVVNDSNQSVVMYFD